MKETIRNRAVLLSVALVGLTLSLIAVAFFNQDWEEPDPSGGTCSCVAGLASNCSSNDDGSYWGEQVSFGCTSTSDANRPVEAWVNCPGSEGGRKVCQGDFEGKADRAGVVCKDSGGDPGESDFCG